VRHVLMPILYVVGALLGKHGKYRNAPPPIAAAK